ncbi:MAG: cation:proton antiporter [Myxococcales bacterium]|nr:cation:proton antiporter [Myxococcales bacterium]
MIPLLVLLALAGLMQSARSFAPAAVHAGGTELAFGFLLLTAYFTGKLVGRIGLPKLTGYIAAGIAVGPYALGLVDKGMTIQLKLVGGIATAILALTAGAELNLRQVRPLLGIVRKISVWVVLGSMLAIAAAMMAVRPLVPFLDEMPLDHAIVVSLTLATALTAKSPAVVMAMIGETRADGVLTKTILTSVIVSDLAVIVLYGIVSSVATAVIGGGVDVGRAIGGIAWGVLGSMGVGIFIGAVLGQFILYVDRGVGLFAVMLCFIVAEVGHAVTLDPLVIALAAGLWLENVSRADARKLLDGFDAASLPVYLVFFALAGAKLDVVKLAALAVPVVVLVLVRAGSFFVGGRLGTRAPGVDPLVRRLAWIGLVPQAGLALALAELVRRTFPAFGDAAFALVLGVVATNELTAPVALRIALMGSGEAGKRAGPATTDH